MFGCTSIRLLCKDGSPIYGRTLDYSVPFHSKLRIVPPGTRFQGTSPYGSDRRGKTWTSVYKYMGLNTSVPELTDWVVEGINEKGLVASALYLPHHSMYETPLPEKKEDTIACWEVVDLLLGTCSDTAEAEQRLRNIVVAEQGFPVQVDWIAPRVHFHIVDSHGGDIVVEYIKDIKDIKDIKTINNINKINGTRKIYQNPLGVLTNEPPFDQQLQNLARYSSLTPRYDSTAALQQNGNGLLGLPGDYTSLSRFVRASILSRFATQPRDANEGERLMQRIMGNFELFPGIEYTKENHPNLTQWTVIYDVRRKKMSIHNMNLVSQVFVL